MVDDQQFDMLVQSIGRGRTRRAAFRVLLGALIAPLLPAGPALAGRRDGKQKRRGRDNGAGHGRHRRDARDGRVQQDKKKGKKAKPCPACKKRKQGKCKGLLPDGTTCPGGTCRSGQCMPTPPPDDGTCPAGFHECNGTCVKNSDVASCGTSCTPCPTSVCSPATCDGTTCGRAPIARCCEEDADCGVSDTCTSHTCGPQNTCTHVPACLPNEVCSAEGATPRCCPQTRPIWNGTRCVECLSTDLTNCPDYVNAEALCDADGRCGFTCDAGWSDCSAELGCETDLTRDLLHCGACGHACSTFHNTPTCEAGRCVLGTCDVGWQDCDGDLETGCETHLQTDPDHCGACGHACSGGDVCRAGACTCLPATDDLQAAIDATKPGRALRLCAGTWTLTKTITIARSLTLKGAGVEQSILDGNDQVRVVRIAAGVTVTLQDLTVTKGFNPPYGGSYTGAGILNQGTLSVVRCAVSHSREINGYGGGGIYNDRGTLELSESSVTDNGGGRGSGGGIENNRGTVTLKAGSLVATNGAAFGGGIYNVIGTLTLDSDSSVTGNSATSGGGIYNHNGTVRLETGCQVSGNTASSGGGGIENYNGTVTLNPGSSVTDNTGGSGGGINNAGTLTLETDSRVAGNSAQQNGGGIYVGGANGPVTLKSGSRVADNSAGAKGGGIYTLYGAVTLEAGCRVTNNTAQDGGGIFNFNDPTYPAVVTPADTDIVTENYLTDGATVSNCVPVDTIPNCIG